MLALRDKLGSNFSIRQNELFFLMSNHLVDVFLYMKHGAAQKWLGKEIGSGLNLNLWILKR